MREIVWVGGGVGRKWVMGETRQGVGVGEGVGVGVGVGAGAGRGKQVGRVTLGVIGKVWI